CREGSRRRRRVRPCNVPRMGCVRQIAEADSRPQQIRSESYRCRDRPRVGPRRSGKCARCMAREGGQTVRVNLRGIHSAIVKLASGKRVTYWYAWRKGPRLVGEPGSPEFIASYTAAHASRREPDGSRFHSIIAGYKASQDFAGLEPRTKSDYLQHV